MKMRIIILMVLVASLTFAQGRRGNSRMMTWDESLNLTTEQMQQITELRDAMQPAMMEIRQKTRTLEIELGQLSRSDNPDTDRISELEGLISDNEAAIKQIQASHHTYIRTLLTEEQQLIFDQLDHGAHDGGRNRGGSGKNSRPGRGNRSGGERW